MEEPNILVKTALNEAVQKVNSGVSPTEALKKVANDLDLNPNYIQRTGEALNVALHYRHFKTASDRSTEFEIADIPKAIQETFTVNEKTAAEYASETFGVNEANETVFNYNRMLSNPAYKQAYLKIAEAPETHDSFSTTFNTVYEKSNNYIHKLAKLKDEAEVEKVAAELELNSTFSTLCDEFKKDASYRTSFEEFESQVFAKHGEQSLPYLDLIHKTAAKHEERGVHDSGYMMFDQCKEAALFDHLFNAASRMLEAEKTANESAENLSFETSFLKECRVALGKKSEAKEDKAHENKETDKEEKEELEPEDHVLAEIKKKASDTDYTVAARYDKDPVVEQALEKEAMFGSLGSLAGMLSGPMSDAAHENMADSFSSALKPKSSQGPSLKPNMTLDNMERKLLLQELLLTDPILSRINPAKVARAYEQLLRLSPEVSKEKEVVRAELRAMVASQALGKFEAETLTKLDTGMLKRRIATHQFNSGMTDHFKL
jgi:hypothetical protein